MAITIPQISIDEVYISVLKAKLVKNEEGWSKMMPVNHDVRPSGSMIMDAGCPREASQRKKVLLPSRSGGVFPKEGKRLGRGYPGTHRHVSFSLYDALPLEASPGIPVLHVADSHRDCHPVWLS